MLKLKNITKDYVMGNTAVNALKDVSLTFRESEFVSILGASGCGKTTLLNIIGGLDRYTTGNLIINGVSTKKYKPKDWDAYRNHSVGFVFQNYNLISHLSILKNVELALTLSGIRRKERKARAIEALISVGLEEQVGKKPNQLSGGQMQRVAIARALVNNPSILLADEPTGALDSKTSVQIMDILKKISQNRLIVMVTHNPEIADAYSTRIVRLSDGEVVHDSNPYITEEDEPPMSEEENSTILMQTEEEELDKQNGEVAANAFEPNEDEMSAKEAITADKTDAPPVGGVSIGAETRQSANEKKKKFTLDFSKLKKKTVTKPKTSMSYFTALSLSVANLMTKKGRTIITAIAGSIGILGIALVLSVSYGFNIYIQSMEESIMTNQPIAIQQTTIDLEEMQNAMMDNSLTDKDKFPSDDKIYPFDNGNITNIASYTNNLSRDFINFIKETDPSLYRSIDILRNLSFHVIAKNDDATYSPMNVTANGSTSGLMSMFSGGGKNVSFNQLVNNKDYVLEHYDLLKGKYPSGDNDVVLVLDKYNRVSEDILSVLGYKNIEDGVTLEFNEILSEKSVIKVLSNNQYFYKSNELYKRISTIDNSTAELGELYRDAYMQMNIVGIMRVKPGDTSTMLSTGLCFQEGIATKIFSESEKSHIVKDQMSRIIRENQQNKKPTSILSGEELSLTSISDLTSMNLTMPSVLGISIPGLSEISAINIYPVDLDAKDKILQRVDTWNDKNVTVNQIKYTDTMSFMFSSFETMLTAITYVLIAFVAISLIVSTVMIGIITYVSVIERTKEIGILRALGARKKDISRVFNSESVSIGFSSGFIGIFVSWVLLFPINAILQFLTDIPNLAVLNGWHAMILLGISMLLTFISGLIPSKIASKKDPIQALRTD